VAILISRSGVDPPPKCRLTEQSCKKKRCNRISFSWK